VNRPGYPTRRNPEGCAQPTASGLVAIWDGEAKRTSLDYECDPREPRCAKGAMFVDSDDTRYAQAREPGGSCCRK
jgi:hypothetical protein